MLSKIQTLRELIDNSESITLINLDIHRNVMLRLSLQLEMGMFSAAMAGLLGVAFGMNLESSLEEVQDQIQIERKGRERVFLVISLTVGKRKSFL